MTKQQFIHKIRLMFDTNSAWRFLMCSSHLPVHLEFSPTVHVTLFASHSSHSLPLAVESRIRTARLIASALRARACYMHGKKIRQASKPAHTTYIILSDAHIFQQGASCQTRTLNFKTLKTIKSMSQHLHFLTR